MKQLQRNVKIIVALFIVISLATLVGLVVQQRRSETHFKAVAGENKQILRSRYRQAGRIISADGVILADSSSGERLYAQDWTLAEAMLSIVGDYTHNITNTIESQLQGPLLGNRNDLLKQVLLDIRGQGFHGDDVRLSTNSVLSRQAYQLLNGRKGAVVVLNYQTGDVMVSVSSPSTHPTNVINWQNIPDTALFNRALNGRFIPGSLFKVITTSAWLQSATYNPILHINCEGNVPVIQSGAFENYETAGHGDVDLHRAFAMSCNIFFGTIGMEVGAEALEVEAALFGFGKTIDLPYLAATTSRINVTKNDRSLLSWAAVGQPAGDSDITLSPLHMAMIAGGIANEGRIMVPHVVRGLTDPLGVDYDERVPATWLNLPARSVETLRGLMRDVVTSGTGRAAAVYGRNIGGKTGTMELINDDGDREVYSLFMGFDTTAGYPYAIAVVVQNTGSSGAQIAGNILATMTPAGQ